MGLFDQFSNLSPDQNQGLLAAAAQMLQTSGPSLMPHSFGQVLGQGLGAYQSGLSAAQEAAQKKALFDQAQALNGLKLQDMQSDVANQALVRERQAKINAEIMGGASPQPQPQTQSDATPAPASSAPMGGSIMAGMGAQAPSWMPQQSAPTMPTQPAPQAGAPANAAPDGDVRTQAAQRLLREAAVYQKYGDFDNANKRYEAAIKLQPKFTTDFRVATGSDGKLHNYLVADDGSLKDAGVGVRPDMTSVDLGGTTQFVDKNAVAPGQTFNKTMTFSDRTAADRLKFEKSQAESDGTGPLTKDAIDLAADRYNFDGTLPPMGMGKAAAAGRSEILNRAAERKAQGILPGSQRAEQLGNVNDIKAQGKALRDFTGDGKSSQAIQATNTGLNHLETIKQLALAQKSGDVTTFNRLARSLGAQFGQTAPTNLNAALVMVAPEVSKAVVGAGGTGHDRDLAMQALNPNGSDDQILGGINTMQDLFAGRLSEAKRTYERSTKRNDFDSFLSPAAQGILSRGQGQTPAATTPTQKSVLKGQVVRGYRFMGGDPSVQSNWEKAQ